MRFTLDLLRRDHVHFVYGQYGAGRVDLAKFYSRFGFRICEPGEPLDLSSITGQPITIGGRADETFFVLNG
jgi:hypothetical protein